MGGKRQDLTPETRDRVVDPQAPQHVPQHRHVHRDEAGLGVVARLHVVRTSEYYRDVMPMKVQELIARLEADGWYQVRQTGSHRQYHHASKIGTVTVSGKPSIDVPIGTLNNILKQAGLRK